MSQDSMKLLKLQWNKNQTKKILYLHIYEKADNQAGLYRKK